VLSDDDRVVAMDDRRNAAAQLGVVGRMGGGPEPHPGAAGVRRRRLVGPPRREMVAAADPVEPGLLCLDGLAQQVVRREALMCERDPVGHLIRLVLTGPTDGPDRRKYAHVLRLPAL